MSKEYTYGNDAGKSVPAAVVKKNEDGSHGIFTVEGDGDQVVFIDNVSFGSGGGYLQEVTK